MIYHFSVNNTIFFILTFHLTKYSERSDHEISTTNLPPEHCASDSITASINDFALQLTNQLSNDENLFISPFSIYIALMMMHLGAGGHTANQLEAALEIRKYNLNNIRLHRALKNILQSLTQNHDEYSLLVANSLFVQQNFAIKKEYKNNLQQIYRSVVKTVDFAYDGQTATKEINNWVSDNTRRKIEKLLNEPLDPDTRLVLLNAIYFKGVWQIEFPKNKTVDRQFFLRDGTSKEVKMMHLEREFFRYCEDSVTSNKFLELPYKGNHIVMLLALPTDDLAETNLEMTPEILCRVNESMSEEEIDHILIPKFKFEYEVELKDILRKLGIKDLFSKAANLTGIRNEKDLFVSSVLHKAVIDVNEEGSEAAAVAGILIQAYSARRNPTFIANRPFTFYIIDNRRGMILFTGRVVNP